MTRIEVKNKKQFMAAVKTALQSEGYDFSATCPVAHGWLSEACERLENKETIFTTPLGTRRIVLIKHRPTA